MYVIVMKLKNRTYVVAAHIVSLLIGLGAMYGIHVLFMKKKCATKECNCVPCVDCPSDTDNIEYIKSQGRKYDESDENALGISLTDALDRLDHNRVTYNRNGSDPYKRGEQDKKNIIVLKKAYEHATGHTLAFNP